MLVWLGVSLFVALVLYQTKIWLDTGFWPPLPVRILFVDLFPVSAITRPGSWYNHPTRWFGMHAAAQFFLEDIPLSLFLLVMGRVLSLLFEAVAVRLVPRISTTSTPTIATFK